MGQYWKAVNLKKREFLNPNKLGSGLKLWEQMVNLPGVPVALFVLQACMPERRGGGDLGGNIGEEKVIGRWAGDPVALVGDYSEDEDLPESPIPFGSVYELCYEEAPDDMRFTDITDLVIPIIERELEGRFLKNSWGGSQWFEKDQMPEAVANQLMTGDATNDAVKAKPDVGAFAAPAVNPKPRKSRSKKAAATP